MLARQLTALRMLPEFHNCQCHPTLFNKHRQATCAEDQLLCCNYAARFVAGLCPQFEPAGCTKVGCIQIANRVALLANRNLGHPMSWPTDRQLVTGCSSTSHVCIVNWIYRGCCCERDDRCSCHGKLISSTSWVRLDADLRDTLRMRCNLQTQRKQTIATSTPGRCE
jgi:hypothetical protein